MTASAWTDDRIDRLKTLWLEGQTADQIARTLANGITRSAVLGKVYRMGLSAGRSAGPSKAGSRLGPSPIPPACPAAAEPVVPVAAAADAPSGREVGGAPLQSIGRRECRWPLGDPLSPGFTLCGQRVCRGAYCGPHAEIAYRAARDTPQSLERLARLE